MPATSNQSAVRAVLCRIHALAQIAWRNAPQEMPAADRRALSTVRDITEPFADELPEEREPFAVCRECGEETELDPMPLVAVCHACTSRQLRLPKEA